MRTKYRNMLIQFVIGIMIIFIAVLLVTFTGNQWFFLIFVIGFGLVCFSCLYLQSSGQPLNYGGIKAQQIQQPSIDGTKDDESYKTCSHCGALVSDGYFCKECGKKIE